MIGLCWTPTTAIRYAAARRYALPGAHDLNCEGEDLTEAHRRVQPSHPKKLGTPKAVKLLCWRRFRPARAYWCVRGGSELPRGDVASADLA